MSASSIIIWSPICVYFFYGKPLSLSTQESKLSLNETFHYILIGDVEWLPYFITWGDLFEVFLKGVQKEFFIFKCPLTRHFC